jgi:ferredoxin
MDGDGPTHGRPRHVGLLLASSDPVALDATAARLAGVPPERVEHLRLAAARSLGTIAAEAIRVDGPLDPVDGFKLPSNFRAGVLTWLSSRIVFNALHRSRLRVNVRKCRRCGACAAACPAGAMAQRDGAYVIDAKRCQHCFCCAELCPEGAVEVQGTLGALLRRQAT